MTIDEKENAELETISGETISTEDSDEIETQPLLDGEFKSLT